MSHKTQNILLISVIILVIIGLPFWLIMIPVAPYQPDLKPVIVDASRLPTTVNVDGAKITLNKFSKYPGWANANIDIMTQGQPKNRRVVLEKVQVSINGKDIKIEKPSVSSSPDDIAKVDYSVSLSVPKRSQKADITCVFQSNEPKNPVKFSFRNVSPSSLPVTRKVGQISITLNKAYYGEAPEGGMQHRDNGRATLFVIKGTISGPADNFYNEFTLLRDGWKSEDKSVDPYWLVLTNNLVKDELGKQLYFSSSISTWSGDASTIFETEIKCRTLMESIISRINRPKASTMITNRAMRAAIKSTRTIHFEYCFKADRLPKHFTWEPTVNVQLKDRKRTKIIFRNVPVPP